MNYIKGTDFECWRIIVKGLIEISNVDAMGDVTVKKEDDYDEEDFKKAQKNFKVMSMLQRGISKEEFNRFSSCISTKEIWDSLKLAYEDESINDMSARFSSITNELRNLGNNFETEDLVRKVLRSLNKKWQPKVTVIEEAKDLSLFSYESLLGSLMAHELQLNKRHNETTKSKGIALQANSSDDEGLDNDKILECFGDVYDNYIEQRFEIKEINSENKELHTQINDIAEENFLLKEKVKKLHSKKSVDSPNVSKHSFASNVESPINLDRSKYDKNPNGSEVNSSSTKVNLTSNDVKVTSNDVNLTSPEVNLTSQQVNLTSDLENKVKLLNEQVSSLINKLTSQESNFTIMKSSFVKKITELQADLEKSKSEPEKIVENCKNCENLEKEKEEFNKQKEAFQNCKNCENLTREKEELNEKLKEAFNVSKKWEASETVLNFLTQQSNRHLKEGIGYQTKCRQEYVKKFNEPSNRDFRKREYVGLPEYITCNYCGKTGYVFNAYNKRFSDQRKNETRAKNTNNNNGNDSYPNNPTTKNYNRWKKKEFYQFYYNYNNRTSCYKRIPMDNKTSNVNCNFDRNFSTSRTPPNRNNNVDNNNDKTFIPPRNNKSTTKKDYVIKQMWIRKDLLPKTTNKRGPNFVWVPKAKK
ncbi:hypothetical protein RND81_04G057900 [Saponaria officinalis]|uniref:UBN2 domain-containing protein n=1 Tax=Saponaria officinalis TaxID=3572 RepID=A0AAW1LD09_SAPOF